MRFLVRSSKCAAPTFERELGAIISSERHGCEEKRPGAAGRQSPVDGLAGKQPCVPIGERRLRSYRKIKRAYKLGAF
jgi:hypothetical protein